MKKVLCAAAVILIRFCGSAHAADGKVSAAQHQLAQRLVLFPLQVEKAYTKPAEDVWWDVRSKLTESKRFLIGSKNFMESKGVFQPRSELKPADAILLGRLLDAHALLTVTQKEFQLVMRAYDGRTGQVLWVEELQLHPSIPVSRQLKESSIKLTMDFIASIPYQGFVVTDEIAGRPLFKEGEAWTAYAYLGEAHQGKVGDPIQVVQVVSKNLSPLFQDGGVVEVVAEGRIKRTEKERVVVELDRLRDPSLIEERSMVRLPKEHQRLQEIYQIAESSGPTLEMDALGQGESLTEKQKERKPLIAAVSFIANIVIMFLVVL